MKRLWLAFGLALVVGVLPACRETCSPDKLATALEIYRAERAVVDTMTPQDPKIAEHLDALADAIDVIRACGSKPS